MPADSDEAILYFASNHDSLPPVASGSKTVERSAVIDRTTDNLISQSAVKRSEAPVASSSALPSDVPPKKPPPMRKKGGMAALSAKLASGGKATKLTTLEKSKLDWNKSVAHSSSRL